MKGLSRYFILCVWISEVKQIMSVHSDLPSKIDLYLNEKSSTLRNTLSQRKHLLYKRQSEDIDIRIGMSTILQKENEDVNFFTFSNATYFRMGKKLFKIKYGENILALTQLDNVLEQFPEEEKPMFSRAIEFEGRGMILTRFEEGEAHIYGLVEDDPFFIQTLFVPHSSDASFFVHNGNLYVIAANNKGDNIAATSLYKWLGSHFDEIQTVFTTGAIKVTTFSSQTSEIIIILRQLPNRTVSSDVYEFRNDEMKKIQILKTEHPISMDTYLYKNGTRVIIYEKSRRNIIYQWNGVRLTKVDELETRSEVNSSQISTVNQRNSMLMIPFNDTLSVYSLSTKMMKMRNEVLNSSQSSGILDLHNYVSGNIVLTFIASSSRDGNITISLVYTTANFSGTETVPEDGETLRRCFNDLELKAYEFRKTLLDIKSKLIDLNDLDSSRKENISNPVLGESLTVDSPADNEINQLKTRLNRVDSFLDSYIVPDGNSIVINGSLVVKGETLCHKMAAGNVKIKLLNKHKFTPEQWLRYEEPQTITGPVKLKQAVADHWEISPDDTFLKDMVLMSEGKLLMTGEAKIRSLVADKMYAGKINNITVNEIHLKSDQRPIKGLKTFENLRAAEVDSKLLNGEKPNDILSFLSKKKVTNLKFDSDFVIKNLTVKSINGIDWDEFKNSVFRIGSSFSLAGPLHFTRMKTENLWITKLKEVAVDDLLTKSTNQTIDSNIIFNRIFAEGITAESVNGIKLSESAVTFGTNDSIGPVRIDKLNVDNELELSGDVDDSLFLKNGNRIMGTNESDLLQQYWGAVKIKGDLYLRNFTLQPDAKMLLSENEIVPDIKNIYWTKSTDQKIPTRVTVQGLKIPHVLTNVLNGVKFSQYMINSDTVTLDSDYHFEKVTVIGDISLHNTATHKPDLDKLNREAVRTKGSHIINGQKTYTDTLRAENLVTSKLEGINTLDVLNTRWPANVTETKIFKNLIVEGNVTSKIDHVHLLNDVDVENFKKEIIYIDQENHIKNMNFKKLNVADLHVQKMNGHQIVDYVDDMNKLISSNELENLVLNGNVTIRNVFNISEVNGVPFEDLLDRATRREDQGGIEGDVRFSGKVRIGNLVTLFVNGRNMRSLTKRLFLRNLSQTITAPFSFGNLEAGNINTPRINNVSVTGLVDITSEHPQQIEVPDGITFSSDIIDVRSLKSDGMTPCDIKTIARELSHPSTKEWSSIKVLGDVTLSDDQNVLYRIFENSVRMSTNNTIHAPVTFASNVSTEQINLNALINDVNISGIIEDAVLTDSEETQIITGQKWFTSLETEQAVVMKSANITIINGENIESLNDDIVDKNNISGTLITGKKTFFGGLQTNKFNTEKINDVDPSDIVNLDNLKKIPSAIFDFLNVSNELNISFVNNIDFNNILIDRILCNTPDDQTADGIYYFEDVDVEDLSTPSINDIKVDDIVFDIGTQNITGPKRFSEIVNIFGDMEAELVNGIRIREEYNKSLSLAGSANVDGSIVVLRPSYMNGTIQTDSINGLQVSTIEKILADTDSKTESREILRYKDQVVERIQKNIPISQGLSKEYMYLEKSDELQISVPNTVTASIISSKGYVLLHVTGEEPSGENCGLPKNCECKLQYALEISPERSVTVFPNKGPQRIFSYDDDTMIIHFITNSVSTSANCSTGKSKLMNEVSMMTWNTLSTTNTTGQFYQYQRLFTGYISKVVYFSLNDITYALVGRYYDPVLDSYDLDCTVIRFDEERKNATEIQKIATRGVNELHVFHTAQGVVLIVGNTMSPQYTDEDEQTQIYRFNQASEKFEFMRMVPSLGCSEATGVVLGTDSFIVLAHRIAPVQVLKYLPEYDNYYFYQSFELDEPVIGISSFYSGDYGVSDAYLTIITGTDKYFIYSYEFLEGWKLISSGELEGLRNLIPFEMERESYLFAPSTKISSLLTVVKNGSN